MDGKNSAQSTNPVTSSLRLAVRCCTTVISEGVWLCILNLACAFPIVSLPDSSSPTPIDQPCTVICRFLSGDHEHFQWKYLFQERPDVRQRLSRSVAILCQCQRRQTRKNQDSAVYVTLCRCLMYIHIDGWQHLSDSLFICVYILKCQADQMHDWNYNLPLLVVTCSCMRHLFSWCKSKMPGLCLRNDSHTSSPESA